jgi:hypothetical protein
VKRGCGIGSPWYSKYKWTELWTAMESRVGARVYARRISFGHVEAMRWWVRGRHVRTVARVGGCSQARLQSQGVVRVEGSEISCLQR